MRRNPAISEEKAALDHSETRAPAAVTSPLRVGLLDVARGLAMIIVLYGHGLEVLFFERPDDLVLHHAFIQFKALSTFAMPLFFLISGAGAVRLACKAFSQVLRGSLFMLVLAYCVHGLGLIALAAQQAAGYGPDLDLWRYGLESSLKGRNFSTTVVWFLVSLAFVRMIVFAVFSLAPPRLNWTIIAAIGLASLLVPFLPHVFMLRTWFAGCVFFALGMALAGRFRQLAPWLGLALAPLVALLALANRGCPYDPVAVCAQSQLGLGSVVWLHAGEVGFIPLFYVAALLGCVMAMAMARGLASSPLGAPLARIGKKTLDLLVINGFVLNFVQPWLKRIPLGEPGPWIYPLVLAGVLALHLALLRLLRAPLSALQRFASRLAEMIGKALARAWAALGGSAATRSAPGRSVALERGSGGDAIGSRRPSPAATAPGRVRRADG